MEPKKPRGRKGPERIIQNAIISMLRNKEWFVKETHGNMYQSGFPDMFACHYKYGHRWIDAKNPGAYKFTPAQIEIWPKLCANGSGVWIMVAANEDEYAKLFKKYNWWQYLESMK